MKKFPKIGILGGGQLGKMLCEAALPWHLPISILDRDITFPAAHYTPDFQQGDFTEYSDVLKFGREQEVVSIEIEKVNVRALYELEKEGVKVFPQPKVIEIIQDKGRQKMFFDSYGIPTAPFENMTPHVLKAKIESGDIALPVVQKSRTGGYDGQGVQIVRKISDIMPVDSMVEAMADIEKELSVIVARKQNGEVETFDPVEMVFDPVGNLVDYLISPANIAWDVAEEARNLAIKVAQEIGIVGILAVEMFLNKDGSIWVNEVAPRPHNSGHQTIKNAHCSQYEQLLRVLCDLPLISGVSNTPGMMINILGSQDGIGTPIYEGLDVVLREPGIHLYLYGKKESRPFRKMGHFTITGDTHADLIRKSDLIKENFKISIE